MKYIIDLSDLQRIVKEKFGSEPKPIFNEEGFFIGFEVDQDNVIQDDLNYKSEDSGKLVKERKGIFAKINDELGFR